MNQSCKCKCYKGWSGQNCDFNFVEEQLKDDNKFYTTKEGRQKEKCGKSVHLTDTIECDDGNLEDGDGCDHNCNIEPYWKCEKNENLRSICIDTRPLKF